MTETRGRRGTPSGSGQSWGHVISHHDGCSLRFSEGTWNPLRRATLHKRAGELHHLKDYNSVPFMGKRSEERGDLAARPGDSGVMVRKPR